MDLRQLRYFVASAEEGHMGRAAARLFVVQSALSRQVRELEREVGGALFLRTPRGVVLTEAGTALLPLARRTLEAAAHALETARIAAQGASRRLRVALPDVGPWTRRVAEGLDDFRRAHPAVEVELVAIPWVEHVAAVLERRIDVGFAVAAGAGVHPAGLAVEVLSAERLGSVLLPRGHPLARRRILAPEDLVGLPMVLSDRAAIGSLHDVIRESVAALGIEGSVLSAPGSFAGVVQLVAGGAGWAAVLDVVREAVPSGTVARTLRGLGAVVEFHAVRRDGEADRAAASLSAALRTTWAPAPPPAPGSVGA